MPRQPLGGASGALERFSKKITPEPDTKVEKAVKVAKTAVKVGTQVAKVAKNYQKGGLAGVATGLAVDALKDPKGTYEIASKGVKAVSDLEKASLSEYPRAVQNFINKNGDKVITNMKICRRALPSLLETALNLISLGTYNKAKAKGKYDKLFHLYTAFYLDGKRVILDKSQNINLKFSQESCDDHKDVKVPSGLTLREFLQRGRKRAGDAKFFTYDALKNNCQDFLYNLLSANNMMSSSPGLKEFIKQDTIQLAEEIPSFAKKIANAVTKVSGLAERAYQNLTLGYEHPT